MLWLYSFVVCIINFCGINREVQWFCTNLGKLLHFSQHLRESFSFTFQMIFIRSVRRFLRLHAVLENGRQIFEFSLSPTPRYHNSCFKLLQHDQYAYQKLVCNDFKTIHEHINEHAHVHIYFTLWSWNWSMQRKTWGALDKIRADFAPGQQQKPFRAHERFSEKFSTEFTLNFNPQRCGKTDLVGFSSKWYIKCWCWSR